MADEMLDSVVHNLTHRRFKNTSRQSVYELGSAISNTFFDPRNVSNFENGEIAPEGKYLTHYPVNTASNTAGFSIMDDEGNDRGKYYPSQVYSSGNVLRREKKTGGSIGGPSQGSAGDYIYFNPYYSALLNPQSNETMAEIAQPHYIPTNTLTESAIQGRGTNAPSSGSAVDYAMNNPFAFPSNFNSKKGGALGAASSGSASDYYDSNPMRTPAMQSETRHFSEFMDGSGAIDWAKYLGYIRRGAEFGLKHAPAIIEAAPKVYEGAKAVIEGVKDAKKEKGIVNKVKAFAPKAEKIKEGVQASIDTIQKLRSEMKGAKRSPKQIKDDQKNAGYDTKSRGDFEEIVPTKKSKKSKSKKSKRSRR